MRLWRRASPWESFLVATVVLASAIIARKSSSYWVGDYPTEAGPAIDALIHGRIHDFLAARPPEGVFSLVVRAPFAALSRLTGGGGAIDGYENAYRFGVFPCVLAGGLFGFMLTRPMEARGSSRLAQLVVVALFMVNPASLRAVKYGHPEEVLAAVLTLAAVFAAVRRRMLLAGVLIALAIGTKEWAALAVLPIALTAGWRELRKPLILIGAVVAAMLVPLAIADPHSLLRMHHGFLDVRGGDVFAASIWWPLTPHIAGADPYLHRMPAWLGIAAHPLIIVVCTIVAFAFMGRVRRDPVHRLLPLVALVLLLRALLDPIDNGYYDLPFLLALIAADVVDGTLVPALIATAALALTADVVRFPAVQSSFYLIWSTGFVVHLVKRIARSPAPVAQVALDPGASPEPVRP
jgi:hypothetical protein